MRSKTNQAWSGLRTRRTHGAADLRAAELAWVLLSLIDAGVRTRACGYCVGPLTATDLRLEANGVVRVPADSRARLRAWERRRDHHLRRGHDQGCRSIGVPVDVLRELIAEWGSAAARPFLIAVIDEVLVELELESNGRADHWASRRVRETVQHVVTRRITPVRPGSPGDERIRAALPEIGGRGPECGADGC